MTHEDSNACLASRCLNVLSEEQFRSPSRISYWLYKNIASESSIELQEAISCLGGELKEISYEYPARYWDFHLAELRDPSKQVLEKAMDFLHNNECVHWVEFLHDLRKERTFVANIEANLRSWRALLPEDSQKLINLDGFFAEPYENLSSTYSEDGKDNLPQYLCFYRLGDFYALQTELDAEYKAKYRAMTGLEMVLGPENPLTLKARYSFGMCYTVRGQLQEALELYLEVSNAQRKLGGRETLDYLSSLQQLAFVQFLMRTLENAAVTQEEVFTGLKKLIGEDSSLFLTTQMFNGFIHEARGLLDEALQIYKDVFIKRSEASARNSPMALYAQMGMGSVYRKRGLYSEAFKYINYAYQERLQLWGINNGTVMDSAIHLIVLLREKADFDAAQAIIELATETELLKTDFQRYCQVNHLKALVLNDLDQENFEVPRAILQSLLDDQNQKGRKSNNRSLLWVRLDLATILTENGRGDEARVLFFDIVTPTDLEDDGRNPVTRIGTSSTDYERLESTRELDIAEMALRLVRLRKSDDAERLLQDNKLKWVRKEDFWLFEGSPSVDTAWMNGP